MQRRDRRHGSSEGERPSPLGDGWPPLSSHYVRVSEDFSVPPLVGGRPLVRDANCPLCTLGEDLVAMRAAPENAAWAEHDLALAICSDAPPEEAIESLRFSSGGVEFTEAQYMEHRRSHTPSYRTSKLEALRGLADSNFDDASWRSIFDALHLAAEDLRRGLASGEIRLSASEGLAATKLLSELLSYSITDEGEEEQTPLMLMQAFMAEVVGLVEVHVKDPDVRAALYADLQAASNEHIQGRFDAANSRQAPLLPRGRAENSPE